MTRFLPIVQVFIYLKINLFPHIWFINYEKFNNFWFVVFIQFFVSLKYFFSLNRTFFSATNISHCFSFIRFRWKISTEWMKFNWIKKKQSQYSVIIRLDFGAMNEYKIFFLFQFFILFIVFFFQYCDLIVNKRAFIFPQTIKPTKNCIWKYVVNIYRRTEKKSFFLLYFERILMRHKKADDDQKEHTIWERLQHKRIIYWRESLESFSVYICTKTFLLYSIKTGMVTEVSDSWNFVESQKMSLIQNGDFRSQLNIKSWEKKKEGLDICNEIWIFVRKAVQIP